MTIEEYCRRYAVLTQEDARLSEEYLEASIEIQRQRDELDAERRKDAQFILGEKIVINDLEHGCDAIDVAYIDEIIVKVDGHLYYHLYRWKNDRRMTLHGIYSESELSHFYIPF